jgi:hypothetical protein
MGMARAALNIGNRFYWYNIMISIATNGKFAGPPARTAIFTRSGGDAGGGYYEKPKPIVRINRVRYENKRINIEVEYNDNTKQK